MKKTMFLYTKQILEKVSFDPILFCKEVEKALKILLPYEVEKLVAWLILFTKERPELMRCHIYLKS